MDEKSFDAQGGRVNEDVIYNYSTIKKISTIETDEDDGTPSNYQYNKEIFVNLRPNHL